jgi:Tfp pilus assembly protein PilP
VIKKRIGLFFILLSVFILLFAGCQGGNPFNFIIGKMTKSVDEGKKVSPPKTLVEKESKISEEKVTGTTETTESKEDSLEILEMALGIERFYYRSENRRDPFETLFKGRELNIEDVRMVGSIWGPKGRFALLKDPGGSGYVVGIGDRISNGRVISITSTSVTFETSQYGVTSRVTVPLEKKEDNLNEKGG